MTGNRRRIILWAFALAALFGAPAPSRADPAQIGQARVEAVLGNLTSLVRPGQIGLASAWDGDKYVQCRRLADRSLRCEAAGAQMQPSLARVLTPDHVARLTALGWRLDPAFGNYAQSFPSSWPDSRIASLILQTLTAGYDADLSQLDADSDWVADEPCPPRNGPGQNLAGLIDDAASMADTAIHACAYSPAPDLAPTVRSAADLIAAYGPRVTGEIQRLRVNLDRHVYIAVQADLGYVQCQPQTAPRAIYCEAESADSWPALGALLTPDRVQRLHAAGFADPGRAPNYSKAYPLDRYDDATIARELLTLLHDVYGYTGAPALTYATEKGDE
jgi:hypothetical protein